MTDIEVVMTPFEFLRVASGYPNTTQDSTGRTVVIRLYTVDEFMAANRKSVDESLGHLSQEDRENFYYVTRADAIKLTKPLDI